MIAHDCKPPIILTESLYGSSLSRYIDCSDCACSVSAESNLALDARGSALLVKSPTSIELQITPDFTLMYGPYHQPAVLNQPAHDLLDKFAHPTSLAAMSSAFVSSNTPNDTGQVLIALHDLRLLQPQDYAPTLHQSSKTLSAWIHVTDRCNLRCAYCYLPHFQQDMDTETGRQIIEQIFNSASEHGYQAVKLKYAGGEPLLRFQLIQELHQYAQELACQRQVQLDAVILSNGTLLTETIAEAIKQMGINLMISMDGLGQAHDAHRPYAGRRGSFQDVQRGIKIAKKAGVRITISVTVSNENSEGLPDLVRWILAEKLHFSLNFYRKNSFADETLALEDDRIITGMLAAYRVIEDQLPDYSLLDVLVDRANLAAPHLRTCGVGQDYLVFSPKGHISKCQMEMFGNNSYTRPSRQPLDFVQTTLGGVYNLSVEDKEGCNTCEWKYWCTGGCPLLTYQTTGRFDTRSPNCRIYKALFPAALRLEGMRILKNSAIAV